MCSFFGRLVGGGGLLSRFYVSLGGKLFSFIPYWRVHVFMFTYMYAPTKVASQYPLYTYQHQQKVGGICFLEPGIVGGSAALFTLC